MNYYFAVMPASSGAPKWTLQNCRIEKAETAARACELAFGRQSFRRDLNRGVWLAKNMGSRVNVIRSDKQRVALLKDTANWIDPYA